MKRLPLAPRRSGRCGPWVAALAGLAVLSPGWLVPDAFAVSAGPQPGMTGVPALGSQAAEGLCVQCHNSFALNPDTAGFIRVEGVPPTYTPGQTYTLTVRVAHTDAAALRWGFQMTAVALQDGRGVGEFLVTDPATTQVLPDMSGTRTYIEHGYNGTAIGQPGGASWTFDWKAPAADAGKVGFFAAGNVANADGSNQGDRVYSPSPAPIAETSPP